MTELSAGGGSGVGDAGVRDAPATTGLPPRKARLGLGGWLRWSWRQLTSMRTALILLFLLAVASVPGSVLPQEGIDPAAVTQYYQSHPALAPILNRLSLFSVFAAPWFAAIYLLLFASLAGCVLPRTFRLVGSARQRPPRAPTNLGRLPASASYVTDLPPEAALKKASGLLGRRRFRLHEGDGWVSAEKGYLREVGNLLFHIALLALLFSVGLGGIFGYKANRLLIAGEGFANTPTDLDVFHPGRLVSPSDLQPFSINLLTFRASYVTSGPQLDQPITYDAGLSYRDEPGAPLKHYVLQVNHPLVVDSVSVYLIGHGYAPVFKVTDGTGQVRWDGPVPFIPVDQTTLTSEGVVKVPDAQPDQLGFAGVFLPSAVDLDGQLQSAFPAALNPRVSLIAFKGNLAMNSGHPQSVYTLDTRGLKRLPIAPRPLAAGQSMKLPDGAGTITYLGYRQWVSLAITYDPGQLPALISGFAALAGLILSFLVRRRRVFVRAVAAADGSTTVTLGGLARSDAAGGFDTEFADLARLLRAAHEGRSMQPIQLGQGDSDDPEDFDDQGRGKIVVPAGSSVTAAGGTFDTAADVTSPETLTGREAE
ncbi:MAG TPA: cytochrome c biogenesis protein ResB [Streptosporangiaceae bacterium]|nr:cytochrome c biogenesis protein ResB [Streptosporangiaceae bacterium]